MTSEVTVDQPAKQDGDGALDTALQQLETASDYLGLEENVRQILRYPKRELIVHFPSAWHDGHVQIITGYRVSTACLGVRPKAASGTIRTLPWTKCVLSLCG